jgi:hypothetical protein
MSRPIKSTSKQSLAIPDTVSLTSEQRIEFLANLIVDRIVEDKASGETLLKRIRGDHETRQLTLT